MEWMVVVGFLPMDDGRNCEMYPCGCGNLLVLNQDDYRVGIVLWLRMMVRKELACYTPRNDALLDVLCVFPHKNMQLGRMCVGWMGRLSASLMCVPLNLKTVM
jgi:hypothetical protein